ncbi:alpha-2-macroglobulin-like [Scomber scombrus]|uniref:alpha-2-macroglobulin-like n=1 Tax=Scomber scombrus TaxID=13677 RepID=UPI002DDADF28|nr:alpha-2-macroglobulin-like [Scomber scombrus]
MGLSGIQLWTWTLFVFLSWMFVGQVVAEPQYMVTFPAVLEAGAETTFCVSLLRPSETLVMTVTLMSTETNTTLFKETSSTDFHTCTQFQAPLVQNNVVQELEVEVQGETFHSKKLKKVMIKVYKPMTFVQTDKPIYLPGQTVHFRVISLDTKFKPVSQLYDIIELEDAGGNRIGQWLNTTANGKILQLSYSLNSEAVEGTYKLIVWIDGQKNDHHFKVEKYVLPKFEVKVQVADEISYGDEEIKVDVCAKYTYGHPVPGSVEFELCRPLGRHYRIDVFDRHGQRVPDKSAPCYREIKKTEKNGCATFRIPMFTFTKNAIRFLQDKLFLKTTMEEEGTGISFSQGKTIELSYTVGKLSFIDTPKIYNKGATVEGKVKAVYFNDTPIPDKLVYLFLGERRSARDRQNLTTDSNGIATFSLNTTNHNDKIQLRASVTLLPEQTYQNLHHGTADHTLSMVKPSSPHSETVSSLEVKKKSKPLPCDGKATIYIQYAIAGETEGFVDVMWLILSRGAIIGQQFDKVAVLKEPVTAGELSFQLKVTPDMAPMVQIVAYTVLPSEIVIAHSEDFSTEKCFSNKVSVEFSPSSAVPGEEITLQLMAQPDSLCGVSAVDQSVLIKEPGKTLNVDQIFSLLPVKKASGIPDNIEDPVGCINVRQRRDILPHPGYGDKDDPYSVFEKLGLKMATNVFIRMPYCVNFKGTPYYNHRFGYKHPPIILERSTPFGASVSWPEDHGAAPPIETARSFFPETWIWDLVEIGESGTKDVSLTVPDTITTWETEAFCLSPHGFGLAPRKELTAFQPFFLELTLPYSIIRGEHFELKATVFNYLSSCIMVSVTPTVSLDYTLTPLSDDQYTSCLCANERKTLSWSLAPSVLGVMNVTVSAEAVKSHASCNNEIVTVPERGRIDVVTRPLIVKAEGTEMTKTHNWLLCPKDDALTEEVELQLPENVIDGSARASLSVLGDILGRALKNLDGLLKMPYGCGEQNMALLAPNIYILQYLKNTDQMTPAIKEKATNFLTSGYQRQLNYKHYDGAYSTFGGGTPNTWLTAFVLRSFAKAQSFIYIDPAKIEQSKTWLERRQLPNGCFQKLGTLFHKRMKGGVSDEVTLSAYITAAFLEMNISAAHPVVNKSLSCLKESTSDLKNTYTAAMLAYVFTLAGDMETRAQLLEHLDKVALHDGGLLHWSQTATETSASLSVEISSYVMLAKLSASPTVEDLGYTSRIVRWLTGQQNHYGGFSSTQDTVVALQALALYSTLVFSPESSSTVTVQSPSDQMTFDVNSRNKLLYQEKTLQDVTGKYSLEVKGTACAAVQISLHYNIPTPADVTTLSVKVTPEADCQSLRPKLTLNLQSLFSGKESSTNMVILDIKMLSGFVPHQESLKQLKRSLLVDRVEVKEDHVLVYLEKLIKNIPIKHSLDITQELEVQNLKPALVKIYDYYQPSDQDEVEYIYPCAAA